jgi:hypothetical protein
MYLLTISLGLCVAYFVVFWLFSVFFTGVRINLTSTRTLLSLAIIFAWSCIVYAVTFLMTDLELGNRVLHLFGGGVMGVIICFLAARDGRFVISRLQFFIMSLLLVTAMGVFNEHVEYFLQTYVRFLFYSNPRDTWLDLLSNTGGILLANMALLPFLRNRS